MCYAILLNRQKCYIEKENVTISLTALNVATLTFQRTPWPQRLQKQHNFSLIFTQN